MAPSDAPRRPRNPEQTRRDIIDAAIAEFSAKGLSGARVDDIAARTATTKRMIYYYFGSKEQLYAAVIEEAYGWIRDAEQELRLDDLPPREAIRRLVELTFDYHAEHPEFVRLVSIENIHGGQYIAASDSISRRNDAVIRTIQKLLDRGVDAGDFRPGIDALDLHLLISSFSFYRVSNRHTLGVIFRRDLRTPEATAPQRVMLVEAVLGYLAPR
jgi:AcrR family transcriptional regulator